MQNIEYIPGSDAGSLYRVIATKGRVRLGVKPVFAVGKSGAVAIGWNVRSAVPEAEVGDDPVTAGELTKPWPKIHFHKRDSSRASYAQLKPLSFPTTLTPKKASALIETFLTDKSKILPLVKGMLDKLDVEINCTDNVLADWYSETLLAPIEAEKAKKSGVNEAKVKSEVNDLLAGIFKTKP